MNATIEHALVNWYEVERASRWSAAEAKRNDVVHIGAVRPKSNAALDGLFLAVEDALDILGMRPSATEHNAAPLLEPLKARFGR